MRFKILVRSYLLWTIFLILNIILFALFVYYFVNKIKLDKRQFFSRNDKIKLDYINSSNFSNKNKVQYPNIQWHYLIFINLNSQVDQNALNSLIDAINRLSCENVRAHVIFHGDIKLFNYYKQKYKKYINFIYDKGMKIHTNFGVAKCFHASILANNEGKIDFATKNLLSSHDIYLLLSSRLNAFDKTTNIKNY